MKALCIISAVVGSLTLWASRNDNEAAWVRVTIGISMALIIVGLAFR